MLWKDAVENVRWNNTITLVVWVHLLALASKRTDVIQVTHVGCLLLFVIECAIKLRARGFVVHFSRAWSWVELAVLLLMMMPMTMPTTTTVFGVLDRRTAHVAHIASVLRAFEASRLTNMLSHRLPSLNELIDTLQGTQRLIWTITSLFRLVLFVYAILTMHLFEQVKWGQALNANMSFETFPQALLSLFRLDSGEDWTLVKTDCAVSPPACSSSTDDCGTWFGAMSYFYSFFVIVFLVFLNLYVAAVLDSYLLVTRPYLLSTEIGFAALDIDRFVHIWSKYDVDAHGELLLSRVVDFLRDLSAPFGLPSGTSGDEEMRDVLRTVVRSAGVSPIGTLVFHYVDEKREKKVKFHALLLALVIK